jgi:hypothetical protein
MTNKTKTKQDLTLLPKIDIVPFFTEGLGLDPALEKMAKEVRSVVVSTKTLKDRKAITSLVSKITGSKTYIESEGKSLSARYKSMPKIIDENRRKAKDFLTALQAEIRQPLTDYEAIKAAAAQAELLKFQVEADHELALTDNELFNYKRDEAKRIRKQEIEAAKLTAAAEAVEAERLKAHNDRLIAERRIVEAENNQRIAEEKADHDRQMAEHAERQRLANIEQSRLHNEQQAQRASEHAERMARQATNNERLRVEQVANDQRAADEARAANMAHVKQVLGDAKRSIMDFGFIEQDAILIVKAIKAGKIANVTINL